MKKKQGVGLGKLTKAIFRLRKGISQSLKNGPIAAVYSSETKQFALVCRELAEGMLYTGNPYGFDRCVLFLTVAGARKVMTSKGFTELP